MMERDRRMLFLTISNNTAEITRQPLFSLPSSFSLSAVAYVASFSPLIFTSIFYHREALTSTNV